MNLNEKIKITPPEKIKTPEVNIDGEVLGDNSIIFGEPVDAGKKKEDKKKLKEKIELLLESIKKDIK